MWRPSRWWIGLLLLAALWLGFNRLETERIEADLASRADIMLAHAVGAPGFSAASGRDVELKGWIFDELARGAILSAAAEVSGVRLVADGLSLPPALSPYAWSAELADHVLTLSGGVSTPRARAQLVAAARAALPKARILDRMSYYQGAPHGFADLQQIALRTLAEFGAGEARLRGHDAEVTIAVATPQDYRAAVARARERAQDLAPVRLSVGEPTSAAVSFTAGDDGRVLRLNGDVASPENRAVLLALAQNLFPGRRLEDGMKPAPGAPSRLPEDSAYVLRALAQLNGGKVALYDTTAILTGQARAGKDALAVSEAAPPPQGLTVDLQGVTPGPQALQAPRPPDPEPPVAPADARNCRAELAAALDTAHVQFEYARAEIAPASRAALDALAAAAAKCPDGAVEVIGQARNPSLARRRAEAVVAFLTAAGVKPSRLAASARGENPADPRRVAFGLR